MAVKKITRKVISKAISAEKSLETEAPLKESRPVEEKVEESGSSRDEAGRSSGGASSTGGTLGAKKACFFCQSKTSPAYTDVTNLRRFLTDRAKIVPKLKSSLCSQHQRRVCEQIKYARHLAILPFVPKV